MNSKKPILLPWAVSILLAALATAEAFGQEIFIYRRFPDKKTIAGDRLLVVHGDLFAQLQAPSTFPSYNDLSGRIDRWTYGFRNFFFVTPSSTVIVQLVAHDDTVNRTKFDWHFSLRQMIAANLALIIGHDSNHDSDHTSHLSGKPFYVNRNYIGAGIPIEGKNFFIEPFTWFFYFRNQRTHLDLSGEKVKQELGLRAGVFLGENATLSFQVIAKSSGFFELGQDFQADLVLRMKLAPWFELAFGAGIWKDIEESPAGLKQSFKKLTWGIAVPF